MNQKLLKLINQKQLVSTMNAIKWRKFINAILSLENFEPQVRYKRIEDEEINGFSLVWWDEVYEICSSIEWLEIDPVKREYRGRLVDPKEINQSEMVVHVLEQSNIPYSLNGPYLRIWGYTSSSNNPEFV